MSLRHIAALFAVVMVCLAAIPSIGLAGPPVCEEPPGEVPPDPFATAAFYARGLNLAGGSVGEDKHKRDRALDAAIAALRTALRGYRAEGANTHAIHALDALGYIQRVDRPKDALACFDEALVAAKDHPNFIVRAHRRRADVFRTLGDQVGELAAYREAYRINGRNEDADEVARVLEEIGDRHVKGGDLEVAIQTYGTAVEAYAQTENAEGEARVWSKIGKAHFDAERFMDASLAYAYEVAMYERVPAVGGARRAHAHVDLGLSLFYCACDRLDDALRELRDVAANRPLSVRERANLLRNIAALASESRRPEDAETAYQAATTALRIKEARADVGLRSALVSTLKAVGIPAEAPRLYWNVWAAAVGRPSVPVEYLELGKPYLIHVDLSTIRYGTDTAAQETIARHRDALSMAAEALDESRAIDLDVLVLADPYIRDRVSGGTLQIDTARVQREAGRPRPDGIVASVAMPPPPDDPVVLGRTSIRVTFGGGGMNGTFDLLVSTRDSRVAASLPVQFCFTKPCATGAYWSQDATAALLHDVATPGVSPTATLRLIQRKPGTAFGGEELDVLLHVWEKNEKHFWRLPQSTDLESRAAALVAQIDEAKTEDDRRAVGGKIFDLLVPLDQQHKFARMLERHLWPGRTVAAAEAPTLSVQMVQQGSAQTIVLPVGMMYVPTLDALKKKTPRADGVFVGFKFRTEIALRNGTDGRTSHCLERWHLVLPRIASGAVAEAIATMGDDLVETWRKNGEPFARATHGGADGDDMAGFRGWVRSLVPSLGHEVILVVSHHGGDELYADDNATPEARVGAEAMARPFTVPSVVILNACGTAQTRLGTIVRRLNERGVGTFFATATEVKGRLAGLYLACLAKHLQKGGEGVPASVVHFAATSCVANTPINPGTEEPTYGARALTYMLLGSGTPVLCEPVRRP